MPFPVSRFLIATMIAVLLSSCEQSPIDSTTVVPLSPTNLIATSIQTNQVQLNWSDIATNETGYKIQRKSIDGVFSDIASTAPDVESYSDLNLSPNTTYNYRVCAYNSSGNSTQYSNEISVTTLTESISLPSVTIGSQAWSLKNLDVATYRNGDPIPQVTDPNRWSTLNSGAWCWYNNDSATYASTYGKLYNWFAVNDPRGLAPNGWHVATENNWNKLVKFLDINADTTCQGCEQSPTVGNALKNTSGWLNPLPGATNSSGLTCLPGGERTNNGNFALVGKHGFWWSASEYSQNYAWYRELRYNSPAIYRWDYFKTFGFSVRLVKD